MLNVTQPATAPWTEEWASAERELAARVSHEIGNPLFVILGSSELLLRDTQNGELSVAARQRILAIHAMAVRAAEALKRITNV